ncbi:MAG: DUF3135 domain-containing protein [Chromatiales bacterium]|nr:DUF3135 domain-containing protein [Chromatiales bacterium]
MPMAFDFDEWARLAEHNPLVFSQRRREILDAVIGAAPAGRRVRLRRLQWRLDRLRQTAGSPLGACQRMYELMWESFSGEHGLAAVLRDPRSHPCMARPRCPVVPLARANAGSRPPGRG